MRYIYPAKAHPKSKVHPVLLAAAVSVIFFSLAGGAAALGFQPLAQTNSNGCNSASIVENSFSEKSVLNSNVSGSQDEFDSAMPAIGKDQADKDDFGTLIVRS